MPLSEPNLPIRHVLPERLFKVAARGETFTVDEFGHLRHCVMCRERLMQFIRQRPPERPIGPDIKRSA